MQTAQSVQVPGPGMVQLHQPSYRGYPRRSRHRRPVIALGILQLIFAGLGGMYGFWAMGSDSSYNCITEIVLSMSVMALAVPFHIASGILEIVSGTVSRPTKRRCLAVACLIMCTLSAVAACANAVVHILSARCENRQHLTEAVVLRSMVVAASIAEVLVCLVASVYCYKIIDESKQVATSDTTAHAVVFVPCQVSPNTDTMDQGASPDVTGGGELPAPISTAVSSTTASFNHGTDNEENGIQEKSINLA